MCSSGPTDLAQQVDVGTHAARPATEEKGNVRKCIQQSYANQVIASLFQIYKKISSGRGQQPRKKRPHQQQSWLTQLPNKWLRKGTTPRRPQVEAGLVGAWPGCSINTSMDCIDAFNDVILNFKEGSGRRPRLHTGQIIIRVHLDANLWPDEWAVWQRSRGPASWVSLLEPPPPTAVALALLWQPPI